jgi:hypothetical protein
MPNLIPRGIIFTTGQDKVITQGDELVDTSGAGITGFTGVRGFTGFFGFTGLQNPLSGITGVAVTGRTGISGETGIAGNQGVTGFQGVTGIIGVTGLSLKGETGILGTTGAQGPTGIIGDDGVVGTQGITGLKGNTGISATGFLGITGLTLPGFTGIAGGTGILANTGLQGITGAGLLGETGIQGRTGIQGITGINDINSIFTTNQASGVTLSYPLDGDFLSIDNQQLDCKATLLSATDGSPTTITIQFGGVTIFNDVFQGPSGAYGFIEGSLIRQSAANQRIVISGIYSSSDASQVVKSVTTANLALDQQIIISVSSNGTGQQINNLIVSKVFQP